MRSLFLICCILLLLVSHPVAAQPVVAASIKPLQLIAMAITDSVSNPLLILDGSQDPHHPSLRPSQRRAMDEADVFLWVGPVLETGMQQAVTSLEAQIITATELPDLTLYYITGLPDPHVWLDSRNAIIMAKALAQALAGLDPDNASRYTNNLDAFTASMASTDAGVARLLHAETFPQFVVYHNGYQYFEFQFGLAHQASFTTNEELQPGIRQVMAIKSIIDERNIRCVVVGPSVNTRNLDNQLERDEMRYVVIDVLANGIAPAKDAYSQWLISVARAFMACRQ